MFQRLNRGGWPYPQPPNVDFEINFDSEQAVGLVFWKPFLDRPGVADDYIDLIRNVVLTENNTPEWLSDGEMGAGLDFDAAATEYLEGTTPLLLGSGTSYPCSFTAWCRLNASRVTTFDTHTVLCLGDPDIGFARGIRIRVNSRGAGNLRFIYRADTVNVASGDFAMAWDTLVHIAGVSYSASDHRVFVQGLEAASIVNAQNTPGLDTIAVAVENLDAGYTNYFNGAVFDVRVYNRGLPPALIWQMAHDAKWELIRPKLRRVWAMSPVAPVARRIFITHA